MECCEEVGEYSEDYSCAAEFDGSEDPLEEFEGEAGSEAHFKRLDQEFT